MSTIIRHVGAVIGAIYLLAVVFLPCKYCENPAVMEKAKASTDDDLDDGSLKIPFTVQRSGSSSFYGIDAAVEKSGSLTEWQKPKAFLAKNNEEVGRLWSGFINRDLDTTIERPPLLKENEWALFVFLGLKDDYKHFMNINEVRLERPLDVTPFVIVDMTVHNPSSDLYTRKKYYSPFAVIFFNKEQIEAHSVPKESMTIMIHYISTMMVKPEAVIK